jgi:hypothetical protein
MIWLRRVAYGLAGLVSAEAALIACLCIRQAYVTLIGQALPAEFFSASGYLPMFMVVVAMGWLLVVVPIILLTPRMLPDRLSWGALLALGAVLGPVALFLTLLLLTHGHMHLVDLLGLGPFWLYSALSSTAGFSVYCWFVCGEAHRAKVKAGCREK